MVGKLVAHPGRRDELMAGIRELKNADGCDLYVVSREVGDGNTIWVVEAWCDDAVHRVSLDTQRSVRLSSAGYRSSSSSTG